MRGRLEDRCIQSFQFEKLADGVKLTEMKTEGRIDEDSPLSSTEFRRFFSWATCMERSGRHLDLMREVWDSMVECYNDQN